MIKERLGKRFEKRQSNARWKNDIEDKNIHERQNTWYFLSSAASWVNSITDCNAANSKP